MGTALKMECRRVVGIYSANSSFLSDVFSFDSFVLSSIPNSFFRLTCFSLIVVYI